jgi:hypothetical protein
VAEARKMGAVTDRHASADYFLKRSLRRHSSVWSLWVLGVAAVISGRTASRPQSISIEPGCEGRRLTTC